MDTPGSSPLERHSTNNENACHAVRRQELSTLTRRLRGRRGKVTVSARRFWKFCGNIRIRLQSMTSSPPAQGSVQSGYDLPHDASAGGNGMVKRFDFSDGVARYELLGEDDDGHHHHLVCLRCGKVVKIQECFLREMESRIARQQFHAVTHKLEFFGLCPRCQLRWSSCRKDARG